MNIFDPGKLVEEVLKPVVRIRSKKGTGSGTVLASDENGTHIVTNHHVIESNIEYKDTWDELLKREMKKEFTATVEVDFSRIDAFGRVSSIITSQADIIITNRQQDIALLKVRDSEPHIIVNMYPEDLADTVPILSPIACCGAAKGEKPIVTFGHLNGVQIEIDNYDYCLSSAASIFGNSGGAVFTPYGPEDTWCYVGIPSRIAVTIIGWSVDAVTHLAYYAPVSRVYEWLRNHCYEYLWDLEVTKKDCDTRREEKREHELAIAMTKSKL